MTIFWGNKLYFYVYCTFTGSLCYNSVFSATYIAESEQKIKILIALEELDQKEEEIKKTGNWIKYSELLERLGIQNIEIKLNKSDEEKLDLAIAHMLKAKIIINSINNWFVLWYFNCVKLFLTYTLDLTLDLTHWLNPLTYP